VSGIAGRPDAQVSVQRTDANLGTVIKPGEGKIAEKQVLKRINKTCYPVGSPVFVQWRAVYFHSTRQVA
jgi:hypothetical protein